MLHVQWRVANAHRPCQALVVGARLAATGRAHEPPRLVGEGTLLTVCNGVGVIVVFYESLSWRETTWAVSLVVRMHANVAAVSSAEVEFLLSTSFCLPLARSGIAGNHGDHITVWYARSHGNQPTAHAVGCFGGGERLTALRTYQRKVVALVFRDTR